MKLGVSEGMASAICEGSVCVHMNVYVCEWVCVYVSVCMYVKIYLRVCLGPWRLAKHEAREISLFHFYVVLSVVLVL